VITSLGAAVGLPSTSGPSKMYSAVAIILLFGLSCYVILVVTGGKARIRELKELRAMGYENAIALAAADDGPSPGPVTPSGSAPDRRTDRPASTFDHLSQFDAGAGLLTIGDDLERTRTAADHAPTADETTALMDGAHTEGSRGDGSRPGRPAAVHNHRGARTGPGQAIFSRFSRG
jgi:hypothetical protein